MNIFHKHKWVEQERFYVSPNSMLQEVCVPSAKLLKELTFGVTTVLYRCENCNKIKVVEILGKDM